MRDDFSAELIDAIGDSLFMHIDLTIGGQQVATTARFAVRNPATGAIVGEAPNASAADLVRALVKLYDDNAATLTPDPLHSLFHDSHPPAAQRIARLQVMEKPA